MTIAEALAAVRARIAGAARRSDRDPVEITLVAVSKTQSAERIRDAYAAGQRSFGENYAQELAAKAAALSDLTDLEWHFIGHLQTNKARIVVRHAHVVHSVDSAALARELGRRAAGERASPLPVLVEVNAGGEPQKAGAAPGELASVLAAVGAQPALVLRGLMSVPPPAARELASARRVFDTLRSLRDSHGGPGVLPVLSMGMSDDFEEAIERGATLVRVGTAIFGPRTGRSG